MPFGPFKDFGDCMSQMAGKYPDEATRQKVCGAMQARMGEKSAEGHAFDELPSDAKTLWASSFTDAMSKNDDAGSAKIAWASVYRHFERGPTGAWNRLKVFQNAIFKSIFKADRIIYGAASVALKDTENDLITEEALKQAFNSYIERGQVLFYHKNIPVGEVLPSYVTPSGDKLVSEVSAGSMNVVVRMYKDTQVANDVWKGIESGELRAFSIGGEVIGDAVKVCEDSDCKSFHNRIDKIDLHEISIVPDPANEAAYFTIIKSRKVETTEPETEDRKKLIAIEKETDSEWAKARNCPEYTDKILKIIRGTLTAPTEIEVLRTEIAAVKAEVSALKPKEEIKLSEPEKKTMTEEKVSEPKPEPNPIETRVAALESGIGEIKLMLAKALAPKEEPKPEPKEPPKVPEVREKTSIAPETPAGQAAETSLDRAWEHVFEKATKFNGVIRGQ